MNIGDFDNERKVLYIFIQKSEQLPKPSTLNHILNNVGEV